MFDIPSNSLFTIIGLVGALVVAIIAQIFNSCIDFKKSKYGLLSELELNFEILMKIKECVSSDSDVIEKAASTNSPMGTYCFKFSKLSSSAFDYFKIRGYFYKINPTIKQKLEEIYYNFEIINICLLFHHTPKEKKFPYWIMDKWENNQIILNSIAKIEMQDFSALKKGILKAKCWENYF